MKEQVLDILKEGINDIEAVKKQYPKMYTQDVIDALRRLQDRINELTIPDVSGCYSIEDVKQAVNFWSMTNVEEKYIEAFLNNR
jgi:hypothetical protein